MLASEDRVRAGVLVVGGLWGRGRPEAQEINYVSLVKVPILMLNDRYDMTFALDTEVKPMFDLLGTPAGQKQTRLDKSAHFIPHNEIIRETLAWLDRLLGAVK